MNPGQVLNHRNQLINTDGLPPSSALGDEGDEIAYAEVSLYLSRKTCASS
jgi:hypothetical protein